MISFNKNLYNKLICFISCGCFLLKADAIFASCVVDNPNPHRPFVIALVTSILLIGIFTSLSWTIHKTLFSHACLFSWSKVIVVITSIMIGVFGSFGIPQYDPIFRTFGSDLPFQISFLIKFNYLLWIPTIVLFILFGVYRKSSNQLLYFRLLLILNATLWILILLSLYLVEIRLC